MCIKVFLHLSATVEFVGSRKISLLHLVEDGLYINKLALVEVEINPCSQKLLCQYGNVESVGVVPCKVASLELFLQVFGYLLEGGLLFHL